MKYALGNMLNGAGGLNADQLALDLQFAADKTLTARRGPTPVLTRGSTGTFVGSNGLIQTAAVNAARFDHDPVTLASRGLLIEEGRSNLVIRSEDFSTSWTRNGLSTVSTNAEVAPDGATTADKLVENTSSGFHGITQIPPTVAGTTYFGSIFIKASGRNFAMIYTGASGGNGRYISIPADGTGTVLGNYNANNSTVTLQYIGNGWYRATILVVTTVGTGNSIEAYASTNGTTTSYTGDGTSGILVWGAQLEAGSFATSYIPTTTSALARSADVCSITGANFTGMYNQPEGTLFADVTPQTVDQASVVVGMNTTASTLSHFIYKINSTINASGKRWGAQTVSVAGAQTSIVTSTDVAVSRARLAYAYKLNDFAFAASGSLVGTDTSGNLPVSPTAMRIGARDDGLAINGHLAAVRYYKKRLDNSKLVSLTT